MAAIVLIASCKTASFETPNSLRYMPGTLYLTNGRTVEGKLVVNTNNSLGSAVKLYVDGEKKPQRYDLHDIEAYQIRGEYFELKEIKGGFTIGRNMSFMKRLTPADSRIHLYENTEKTPPLPPTATAPATPAPPTTCNTTCNSRLKPVMVCGR